MALDAALGLPGSRPGAVTSLTRPTNPFQGQVIIETDTNTVLFYTSGGWVALGRDVSISGTAPSSPSDGQFWFNSSTELLYVRVGVNWEWVANGALAETLFNAKGDLLVGSAADTASVLTAGANNTVLVADSAQTSGLKWSATLAGLTLTAPVISSIVNTGTLTLPTTTDTLVGRATTDTLTNKTLTSPVIAEIVNTGTLALPTSTDTLVGRATTDTLTNKTLTNPIINGALLDRTEENWSVSASGASGTINLDVLSASILYYTGNATSNFTLNIRGDGTTTLSSLVAVNDSITVVFANTNSTVGYYPSVFQIDGVTNTPKWLGGSAPTTGNASSVDLYTYVIVKTSATPTYTVFASQSKFA
jgi:hypothetical protein